MPEISTPFRTQADGAVDQTATAVDFLAAIQAEGDDFIELLEKVHPLYAENLSLWRTDGDIAFNRIVSDRDKASYLVRGDVEEKKHFEKRVELSTFLPETPNLLSDFVGAVFSKKARREAVKDGDPAPDKNIQLDKLMSFIDSAGPEQQPINIMSERALESSLVYGSVDGVLDHPAGEETENPRLSLFDPLQRLDWSEGEDGHFAWVKYLERSSEQPTWDGGRVQIWEYRIFTAPGPRGVDEDGEITGSGQILFFRVEDDGGAEGKKITLATEIDHAFPTIPVRTLYWRKEVGGIGNPWVKPLVMADLKAFRQESDVTWDIFVHAHPWILAWLHDDAENPGTALSSIKLGSEWATQLDPGGEEREAENIQYLAPDTAELSLQQEAAATTRQQLRRMAGNDSDMQQAQPTSPESGVALAYRQAQRAKNFILAARGLQEWEWQLLELIAQNGSTDPDGVDVTQIIEVQYPQEFDQRLTDELHQDLETAGRIGSKTLTSEVKKMLAQRILGDGATQATVQAVMDEIESAPEETEPEEEINEDPDMEEL